MSDHQTPAQKYAAIVVGVVMLVGGVIMGAVVYGNVPLTVVAGVIAVTGLGLLRFALLRRIRAKRG